MQSDEIPKYRKRKKGKRNYAIECRTSRGLDGKRLWGDEWRVHKRYKTEASRDAALKALRVGGIGASVFSGRNIFEYRKAES